MGRGTFFLQVGSDKAEITYTLRDHVLFVDHTFVPDAFRGQGVAKKLVLELIAYAEKENYKMKPICSYVVTFFERYSEYSHLLV